VQGKRGLSADTALRLGHYFQTSPQFWMNLQPGTTFKPSKTDMEQQSKS
jgi:plasmid maintenance system antidote protein VapI